VLGVSVSLWLIFGGHHDVAPTELWNFLRCVSTTMPALTGFENLNPCPSVVKSSRQFVKCVSKNIFRQGCVSAQLIILGGAAATALPWAKLADFVSLWLKIKLERWFSLFGTGHFKQEMAHFLFDAGHFLLETEHSLMEMGHFFLEMKHSK
jgi:hypothetical protein